MAKEDFCFTYYDGDAARDKAHMNRLERGAYDDIISAQRKRGHLSIDDLKKVLSNDFINCWPSLEWVLLKDQEGKYFIEWVDKSIEKMRRHSKKQSENGKKGGRPEKPNDSHGLQLGLKTETQTISQEKPLGDGYGNEEEIILKEEGVGEENFLVPQMLDLFKKKNPKYPIDAETDLPSLLNIAQKIKKLDNLHGWISENYNHILTRWEEITTHVRSDSHFLKYSLSQINKHFQSILQSLNADGTTGNKNGTFKQNYSHKPAITGTATGAGKI